MTKEDWTLIAAIIGALAWSIPLLNLLKKVIIKPKLIPHIDEEIEIGYDENGPFITLAIAFTARHQSVFITDVLITLKHEDNETHTFKWDTYGDVVISLYDDLEADFSDRQRAIALNVAMNSSIDKEIDFVNKSFVNQMREYSNELDEIEEKYLGNKNLEQKIKESDPYYQLINFYKNKFCWKYGTYNINLKFISSTGKEFCTKKSFKLSNADVADLKSNINLFKQQTDIELFSDDYTQFVGEYESVITYLATDQ